MTTPASRIKGPASHTQRSELNFQLMLSIGSIHQVFTKIAIVPSSKNPGLSEGFPPPDYQSVFPCNGVKRWNAFAKRRHCPNLGFHFQICHSLAPFFFLLREGRDPLSPDLRGRGVANFLSSF
jgi:hypothetical protein